METNFLLAEAAQKGIITAPAQELYETGVAQAYEYWNTELPADYLSTTGAYAANGNDPIEQIITQKWIASMINGYEGWIEFRRTGFPMLMDVSASLNNGLIPVRMPYPAEEAALNADNYSVAASATNDNSINVPVWWDGVGFNGRKLLIKDLKNWKQAASSESREGADELLLRLN